MLEELERRNYSHRTAKTYVRVVRDVAEYIHPPPDKLGPEQIRQYQAHLFQAKKLAPATVSQYVSALRFLFVRKPRRHFLAEYLTFRKSRKRLPTVLSPEEVARLIDSARNLPLLKRGLNPGSRRKAGRSHEKSSIRIPLGLDRGCCVRWCAVRLFRLLLPRLSGHLTKGTLQVGGLKRTYLTYVPERLIKGASLVAVMHASGENGAQMQIEMGMDSSALPTSVPWPSSIQMGTKAIGTRATFSVTIARTSSTSTTWDSCWRWLTGSSPKSVSIQAECLRPAFPVAVIWRFVLRSRLLPDFAVLRRWRQTCRRQRTSNASPPEKALLSIVIMNGTKEPLNPFDGGEVKLFGLFRRGKVRASRESAQYFADLNKIAGAPETNHTQVTNGVLVKQALWRNDPKVEVALVAINGGGIVIPQPYCGLRESWGRRPRSRTGRQ